MGTAVKIMIMKGTTFLLLLPCIVARTIAILGSSGGDVQNCSEVESFTKYFVKEGLLHSAPAFVGTAVSNLIWHDLAKQISLEYASLPECNTHFRDRSHAQVAGFVDAVSRLRPQDKVLGYAAFKFDKGDGVPANLTIEPALRQAQEAGVTELIMWDQDAIISSSVLNGVSYDIAQKFVKANKWNVTIWGINGLNTQPDFLPALLYPRLRAELNTTFPNAK